MRDSKRKNVKIASRSSSSDHRGSRFKYKYSEQLDFLTPFLSFQEDPQDFQVYLEEQDTADLVYDSDDAEPRDVKFEFTNIDTLEEADEETEEEPVNRKRPKKEEKFTVIEPERKKSKKEEEYDVIHEPELPTRRKSLKKEEEYDGVDTFLMSIGSTLRQLKPYYRNQVKSKIFQVVQEYELQQIVETEGHPSSSLDWTTWTN